LTIQEQKIKKLQIIYYALEEERNELERLKETAQLLKLSLKIISFSLKKPIIH